jgi:glyoxalase family protein
MTTTHGLHHVTAIAGDPQENLDFYTGVLGLRLVKRSVNQDAPDTYHLFYADGEGRPGTDLTFFPWPDMRPARPGAGHAREVGFAVAEGSLAYWSERLEGAGVAVGEPERRFGEPVLTFRDPHGLALALTETADPLETAPWPGRPGSPVPERHRLRGFSSVRLLERDLGGTARFLTEALGFEPMGPPGGEGGWHRFGADGGGPGRRVEVREDPGAHLGAWGTGGVHHVAFRVADDAEQQAVRDAVAAQGAFPTPVIDRFWFRSVYFKEPGGVLFELATEEPGFTVDEDPEHLGERLILPPWLEGDRERIEAALPALGD